MGSTLRRLIARLTVVLLVVVGTGVGLTGTASATPYNCYYNYTGPSVVGSYGAWAKCYAGSGYYRVGATCPVPPSVWSIYGPWIKRTADSAKSWAYCPAGAKPLVVYVQTRN
jgi:hypothetical protein